MKLKTTLKRPPPRDSTTLVSKYLNEIIDYGGEPYTRAEAILDMQRIGATQGMIDRWFQGYELALSRRDQALQVKLYLAPK